MALVFLIGCSSGREKETIAAKGHNLGEWVEDPAPSCTEQGKKREAAEIAATLRLVSLKRSVMNM